MKVRYWARQLPFRHPFTISRGTKTEQPTLIVELEHLGVRGYGEAPAIDYYHIPVDKMIRDLEDKRIFVEKFAFTEPGRYWHYLHHLFPQNSFLVCALDLAAWDLFGKIHHRPLYELWGLDPEKGPLTDYTIGIDKPARMLDKMKEKPWPVYKIKLGTSDDIELIKTLRQDSTAVFRVDANAAWTASEAMEKIPLLKEMQVELIEQPLATGDWEGMKRLYERSSLPLIADESCVRESDIEKCKGYFHGVNIKLTKCGGITPARRMIENARGLGLKLMLGSMNESSIGSAAIAHLLPLLDYVDMDGPLLLARDLATGLEFDFGKVKIPRLPGLGIQVIELF
jgi:L-alanine-DL-glutamate epimerase-like enolase superfamily enzyme